MGATENFGHIEALLFSTEMPIFPVVSTSADSAVFLRISVSLSSLKRLVADLTLDRHGLETVSD